MMHAPEKYRVKTGRLASDASDGNNGAFFIPTRPNNPPLKVICSDSTEPGLPAHLGGWEHVSVSLPHRCPIWEEMCLVKDLFWDSEDCVVQFHPPHDQYVSNHPFCLHMWRRIGIEYETPPMFLVGIKSAGTLPLSSQS